MSRFLLVLPWDLKHVGGVNRVVADLYDQLRLSGGQPILLIQEWAAKQPTVSREAGRAIVRMRVRAPWHRQHVARNLLAYVLESVRLLPRLTALVRRHRIDVVNVHYPTLEAVSWALLRRLGLLRARLVLSLHGLDIQNAMKLRGFEAWLWRFMLRSADHVVACSDILLDETLEHFPELRRHAIAVHNGVDVEAVQAIARKTDVGQPLPAGRIILMLGSFEHRKGHDVLVRAFACVTERFPDAHLLLVGVVFEAPFAEQVRELTRQLGLQQRITIWPGLPREQAMALLLRSEMLVVPSRDEPFGVVVLEAGALGKPTVLTSACGAARFVRDADTGRVVPADDVATLATALQENLQNPAAAAAMGERLRQDVAERLTLRAVCNRYLSLAPPQSPAGSATDTSARSSS